MNCVYILMSPFACFTVTGSANGITKLDKTALPREDITVRFTTPLTSWRWQITTAEHNEGPTMPHAANSWPLTVEVPIRSQANPRGVNGEQSGNRAPLCFSVRPPLSASPTNDTYSFIHPMQPLYNFSNTTSLNNTRNFFYVREHK